MPLIPFPGSLVLDQTLQTVRELIKEFVEHYSHFFESIDLELNLVFNIVQNLISQREMFPFDLILVPVRANELTVIINVIRLKKVVTGLLVPNFFVLNYWIITTLAVTVDIIVAIFIIIF